MIWFCHQPTSVYKHPAYLLQSDGRKNAGGEPEKTYLHVGALCLQELADDLAQLVSVRELSHGGQLRPSGVLGGRARVRGVHLVQTAAERGHLVRALQRSWKGKTDEVIPRWRDWPDTCPSDIQSGQ